jgi:GNAT superfamily N-acetyltransferase
MSYAIRPYSPADRESVRYICCETGFSGKPIDPVFADREIFADFLTRYYTDWEPESSWVVEHENEVVGYLIGCTRFHYHRFIQALILPAFVIPKAISRLIRGRYDRQSRAFLQWCCTKALKEIPSKPKHAGHFHFNILPEHRNSGQGRRLVLIFSAWAKKRGNQRIYGQIQTKDDRRTERAFQRHGFKTWERREISKFREFNDETVYVSTVVKEL